MKRNVLLATVLLLSGFMAMAQTKKHVAPPPPPTVIVPPTQVSVPALPVQVTVDSEKPAAPVPPVPALKIENAVPAPPPVPPVRVKSK